MLCNPQCIRRLTLFLSLHNYIFMSVIVNSDGCSKFFVILSIFPATFTDLDLLQTKVYT